jgi:hypothetical protein
MIAETTAIFPSCWHRDTMVTGRAKSGYQMASLSVTELLRYVERVNQRLLALERRFAPMVSQRGTSHAKDFSYFKVKKPILPGRTGLAVQLSFNTEIVSAPIDPEDPDQFWLSDEYAGWTEISSAEFEIHDSAHKTLAMVGDIIVAEYRYNKWHTFTEFGLANVRAKVLEDVTYTTGPAVEARYQILIGDDKLPQTYGSESVPVYVTRMVTESQTAGTEFLLSYDRTAKEWFIVETGGGSTSAITCYATADFDALDATIPVKVLKVRNGSAVAVDDEFWIPNKLWKHGTPGEYAYVGVTGTIIEAEQDDDGTWTITELTCTITGD